jgi:hypothetical protein
MRLSPVAAPRRAGGGGLRETLALSPLILIRIALKSWVDTIALTAARGATAGRAGPHAPAHRLSGISALGPVGLATMGFRARHAHSRRP